MTHFRRKGLSHSFQLTLLNIQLYRSFIHTEKSLSSHSSALIVEMSANIKTISPSTNRVVCEHAATSLQQAMDIAKQSNAAFKSFSQLPLDKRREIIVKALAIIQKRKMELGRELSEQMGRPISFSHKEIETMQKRADYLLEIAEEALSPIPGRPEPGFKRSIRKIPVGPTLIIFAWNVSHPTDSFCTCPAFDSLTYCCLFAAVTVSYYRKCINSCPSRREQCKSQALSADPVGRATSLRDFQRSWPRQGCSYHRSVRRSDYCEGARRIA